MAQQTQITRVAERWPMMMKRFPTPESMAKSDEQDVLSLWQGLGYYRRAKHLKSTAEIIVDKFQGEVPRSVEELLTLSGVGKYTAGAIASIAFNVRAPIVDGNVHRVLCRLADQHGEAIPGAWTWGESELLVQQCSNPSVCNEGLMELGATICTPKKPRCDDCPLQSECKSFSNGTQLSVPPPKKMKARTRLHHHAVVFTCGEEIAFEQRGSDGLWAKMWQVPTVEASTELKINEVAKKLCVNNELHPIGVFEHLLTHRIVEFRVFTCKIEREARFTWLLSEDIEALPIASAQRKVLAVHYGV